MGQAPSFRAIESMRPDTARSLIAALTTLVKPRFPYMVSAEVQANRPFTVYGVGLLADSVSTLEGKLTCPNASGRLMRTPYYVTLSRRSSRSPGWPSILRRTFRPGC